MMYVLPLVIGLGGIMWYFMNSGTTKKTVVATSPTPQPRSPPTKVVQKAVKKEKTEVIQILNHSKTPNF